MNIYELARSICQTLFDKGYTAYFAGGWVRDLLLNKTSDEIDIATNAPPHVIQELFPKTIPVGIAFGVVIVLEEGINFEVATFRKDHPYVDGRHPEGVDYSTPEKDAQRRDFTINGIFYDPLTETIYDYVEGQVDLQNGLIRAIGEAQERFAEDRLRMIRAIRFAARFGFRIEEKTADAIKSFADLLLPAVSMERIWQEFCKMADYPHFDKAICMLHDYGLLPVIFPQLKDIPLSAIESRTQSFPYFPLKTPTIVYLLQLFPHLSPQDKVQICLDLKTSANERKIVEFFCESEALFSRESVEAVDWAHFYAHPLAPLFLQVAAAKLPVKERVEFANNHQHAQEKLQPHIERIQTKKPVVGSQDLQNLGISGKKMGIYLKMAERIAINENIQDPDILLTRLTDEISNL